MNSAARMAFLETQTVCDMSFWVEFALQICRFRRNFRFPRCVVFDGISACILCLNISYLKQFSSASRLANKDSFLYWRILGISISYQNIFWRPTPDKKCRFWWNFGGTDMAFWVEFGEIQYVVLDGIRWKIFLPAASRSKKSHLPWFAWVFFWNQTIWTYVVSGGIFTRASTLKKSWWIQQLAWLF